MEHCFKVISKKTSHNALGNPEWIARTRQRRRTVEQAITLPMVWTRRRENACLRLECPTYLGSLVLFNTPSTPTRESTKSDLGWNQLQNKLWRIRLKVSEHRWPPVFEVVPPLTLESATRCQGQKQQIIPLTRCGWQPHPHLVPYLTLPELVWLRTALTPLPILVEYSSGAWTSSELHSQRQLNFVQPFSLGESYTGFAVGCSTWVSLTRY